MPRKKEPEAFMRLNNNEIWAKADSCDCELCLEDDHVPTFFMCDTHKAGPDLLAALIEMCQIERAQDPESRNVHDAQRKRYEALIRKAGGKI